VLAAIVTEANFPECLGGAAVVMEAAEATVDLVVIWVDQGFSGENFKRVIQQLCNTKVGVAQRRNELSRNRNCSVLQVMQ
jgi:putative transposase